MSLLTNPIFLRMVLVFLAAVVAFFFGISMMRRLRRNMESGLDLRASADRPGFTLETYHGVIQRLKEQEEELKRLRQAASDRAAASENISSAILSNLASGVLLFNPAGLVQQANPAARELLGYASVSGLHARDVFQRVAAVRQTGEAEGSSETLVQAVEQALRRGATRRRLEVDYTTPAGQRRVLGVTVSPVRTLAGESLGAACLFADLTEISELARQMRLRESLAALGEMSAGIAHEFKNSLATISGYAQMLAAEPDPLVRQYGGKIAGETDNLSRVVTEFLNFARPQEPSLGNVVLLPLLRDCAHECGVELTADVPADFCLEGDPTLLRRAISNLMRNSAEAGREGVTPRVQVQATVEGDSFRIVLHDNGRGIPQEYLSRVFIPFFTTKAAGTGLGLALVHRIVTQHGGSVAVSSDASGATFTLSFPRRNIASKAAESR